MRHEVEPTALDGVSLVHFDDCPQTHEEVVSWAEEADITLGSFFPKANGESVDQRLELGHIRHQQDRDLQTPQRDPWTHDLMFHLDGTTLPHDQQPVLTLVVARDIQGEAPATTLVDTSSLLELVTSDGLFDDIDPHTIQSVFAHSTYYQQAQPFFLQWFRSAKTDAGTAAAVRLEEIMRHDQARQGVSTHEALIEAIDEKNPDRKVNFVTAHAVTGKDALFFDGCVRNKGLVSEVVEQEDLDRILRVLRWDYLGNLGRLLSEGCAVQIPPATGSALAFVQKGTVHKGEAGFEAVRRTSVLGFQVAA